MRNIAIIPARGGSKRIPLKNIRLFAGRPIISYSIEAAKESDLFDRIIVSTDDDEIATVAKSFGAEVPFVRPRELADDFTGTNAVVKHAIQWLKDTGVSILYVCCIYATAPFIQVKYLRQSLKQLVDSKKSFAFSVTSFPFPVQRAIRIRGDNTVEPLFPEFMSARSQDLEEAFHDAGQFYWGKAEAFLNDEALFSPVSVPVVLPRYLVQDIDTEEDWKRAELMFKALTMVDEQLE
jgi:pseudaminic acid cytidylyltransferase